MPSQYLSIASDYCVAETEKFNFYYGYEETECHKHKTEDECDNNNCYDRKWLFVAKYKGKEIYRSDLEMEFGQGDTECTSEYALRGILEMIEKGFF